MFIRKVEVYIVALRADADCNLPSLLGMAEENPDSSPVDGEREGFDVASSETDGEGYECRRVSTCLQCSLSVTGLAYDCLFMAYSLADGPTSTNPDVTLDEGFESSPTITHSIIASPADGDTTDQQLETVPLPEHIESRLINLFELLPKSHPIFGTPWQDKVRLPMTDPTRSNGRCWRNVCHSIAMSVGREMGPVLTLGSCWMSKKTSIDIARTVGARRVEVLRKVATTRLLAFLADPSDDNWAKVCALSSGPGLRSIDSPFSHACGNGSNETGVAGCINGLDHGRFATRYENESHKGCRFGARVLCPGHGDPPTSCIFVHPSGLVKPCLSKVDYVPRCLHTPKCYGRSEP